MRVAAALTLALFAGGGVCAGVARAGGAAREFVADRTFHHRTQQETLFRTAYDFNDLKALRRFPLEFGTWRGSDLPGPAQPVVKPDFMFERSYRNGRGEEVWFQLIRGRVERAVHVPAICYYNAGWEITEHETDSVPAAGGAIPCGKMAVRRGGREGSELYFYLWEDRGRDFMKGCVMFRVAALGTGGSHADRVGLIKRFLKDLFRHAGEAE